MPIAESRASREVAECLELIVKTVEKHRSGFMRRLGLHNAATIVSFARSARILVEPQAAPRHPSRIAL